MRRVWVLLAALIAFGLFGGGFLVLPATAATQIQLSSDPFVNPSSQHQTQVEPDTFAFGSTIVAAFQSGRFFDGGASDIGWAVSTNGGASFTPRFLPRTTVFAIPAGPYDRASDPSVAFDARHNVWMISMLGLKVSQGLNDVIVSRSLDGGHTFLNPVHVAVGPAGSHYDKNWTACDNTPTSPFFGHCYTEWDDNGQGNLMLMSTSSNGGLTWGAPKPTANRERGGLGGQPVVLSSGKVVVPFLGARGIEAFVSSDGGLTWSTPVVVSNVAFHVPAGGLRAPDLPSAEVRDPGPVVVVWADCRFESGCSANDIVMSTSVDGQTWTAVKRIPLDPVGSGVDHFIPGISVQPQPNGPIHLALGYDFYPVSNCTFSTCRLNVGFSSSVGGVNWSPGQRLAGPMQLAWLANTNQGRMVGDYMSTSFSGSSAFPVYASAQPPVGGRFQEGMFTTPESASNLAGPEHPVSASGVRSAGSPAVSDLTAN